MAIDTPARIAVLGAGPIGLEAALYARFLGYDVDVYERGKVADRNLGPIGGLAIQSDGKILASVALPNQQHAHPVLVRYTAHGRLDKGFGDGGTVSIDGLQR